MNEFFLEFFEALDVIFAAAMYIARWLVPAFLLAWAAIRIAERAEADHPEPWPFYHDDLSEIAAVVYEPPQAKVYQFPTKEEVTT